MYMYIHINLHNYQFILCTCTVWVIEMIFIFLCLVMITDPGINIDKGYSPYDDGVEMDIFIKVLPYYMSCAP